MMCCVKSYSHNIDAIEGRDVALNPVDIWEMNTTINVTYVFSQ